MKIYHYNAKKRAERILTASVIEDIIVYSLRWINQTSFNPTKLTCKIVNGMLLEHQYNRPN